MKKGIFLIVVLLGSFCFSFSLDEIILDIESVEFNLGDVLLLSGTFFFDGYVNTLDLGVFDNVVIEKINKMDERDFFICLGIISMFTYFDDPYTSFTIVESVGVTSLITYAVKFLVGRGRPNSYDSPFVFNFMSFNDKNHSFPSGHSSFAWALFTPLAERYGKPLYFIPFLFSLARVVGDYHWVSDVIFGAFLGYTIGKSFYYTK
ncbi:PA-phosphatase [Thermosipho melanesiensis]|uniref:Phosphoesterase, PA-phosphatase related n=2 Tax=Thermosipho melanesiensis TaxID=46541 RepID=A6LMN8_THEM4|nr:phosphatase PAP2 family protein [Thermosipho melanesiensis]ABR31189.1 phosphoesterase, PA-phosphatase related [Thermosipho melanesiensis BI429]APT74278.1 PA-phosphatase [Thermosipho melanesiensis]OOC36217.1 PA-phosphatase [Thermosipho melanesiensis]OOC37035.1 PA-phosphatase [Thermosipho melanesiensis]OOC37787.1 PA-phosphatase [Thermosipho melanesiensis]